MTYDLLDSVTLASSASSVTFSSISQDYGDLVLIMDVLGSGGTTTPRYQFNSDTGANYSYVQMFGDGSTPQSYSGTGQTRISELSASTTTRNITTIQIMDYSATDKHKAVLSRSNRADNGVLGMASRWANTAAITSIEVFVTSNNFAAGSTWHLYGIAK